LGEAQLSIVGKGSKSREMLIPAVIATRLFANRGNAPASAPVFRSVQQSGYPLTERAINFIVKEAAECAGVNLAASMHWLRHAHASHAIDNGWCGRQATLSEGGHQHACRPHSHDRSNPVTGRNRRIAANGQSVRPTATNS